MNYRYITVLLLAVVVAGGLIMPASAETISIVPSSASVLPGSPTTFQISLDSAPAGISGYQFRFSLSNPVVAEITGVTYPSWVKINETVGVPSDSVTVTGIDLGEAVLAGATNVPFGSVTVRGDSVGSTNMVIEVLKLDTHEGNRLSITVDPVPITVKSSSSGGGGGGGGGGGSLDYVSTTTAATTTATTLATSQPTTAVQVTSTPSGIQVTGTQGAASATPEITTASTPDASGSDTGAQPFSIPWVAVVAVVAIIVVVAGIVIYVVIKKKK